MTSGMVRGRFRSVMLTLSYTGQGQARCMAEGSRQRDGRRDGATGVREEGQALAGSAGQQVTTPSRAMSCGKNTQRALASHEYIPGATLEFV